MSEIFISHAVADAKLAKLLTNFLKEAVGVQQDDLFCSSVPGHGIPLGDDFNAYIKDKIQSPRLVILLMTPAYMESWFCLMELGAAWAKSHRTMAVIVPPVSFSAVTATLGTKQAWDITKQKGLIDFRDAVKASVGTLEKRSDHIWEEKRAAWIIDLKKVLKGLQPAKKVEAVEHATVVEELENAQAEVAALEKSRAALEAQIEKLKSLKDADELKTLAASDPAVKGSQTLFDTLMEAVGDARPKHTSTTVFYHLIMDYFDKSGPIDWYSSDADEFCAAMKYAIIDPDTQQVNWGRDKLKGLKSAICAVVEFMNSEDGQKLAREKSGGPWDFDDLEFWEHHL
ncbi:MAG: Two-component response regulator [Caulobacteraceae bacterium]|nr:Two-component response regulator [Caulobacteraceae bacterium]